MIARLRSLTRRMVSHAATVGGWGPYIRLALAEVRSEGLGAKIIRALRQRPAAADPAWPALDVVRMSRAKSIAVAKALRFPTIPRPQVSIIIPVFNQATLAVECIASIARHPQRVSFEIVVVDDASTDPDVAILAAVPGIRYFRNDANQGFIGACNRAAAEARGRYLHFLNSDTQVQAGWLDALVGHIGPDAKVGIVGSKLLFPDGRLQEAGARMVRAGEPALVGRLVGMGARRSDSRFRFAREVEYCSGASLLISRELFLEVGGFDPIFAPAYFEDVDLAYKVRKAGYAVRYEPHSEVVHHLSASTIEGSEFKRGQIARNGERFARKWREELDRNAGIRLIAFYLPQYHPIPENDAWWGEGFTEWTNVRKAKPNFEGHDQPHIPGELGYYDLRRGEVREQQAALARLYGVHGFCYYYYWFNGKRLLERPLHEVVESGRPDFPFCVCWANENWTRTWDGQDQQVLVAQRHSAEDDVAFIQGLFPILRDARYIRIGGKPLVLVYKVNLLPDPAATARCWREQCRAAGLGEIYLACVHANSDPSRNCDPRTIDFDAAVEFPPAGKGIDTPPPATSRGTFRGMFYDYVATMTHMLSRDGEPFVLFRGVMPSWDNTARRQDTGHTFLGSTPDNYRTWLEAALDWTSDIRVGEERIVFINAWNEWAEGNHLEPDHKHGRAFLDATRSAIVARRGK